jgi:hypothetical protein
MAKQPLGKLEQANEAKLEVLKLLSRASMDESKLIATFSSLARTIPQKLHPQIASVSDEDFARSLDLETLT